MSKTPIDPKDIRKGDLIRWEGDPSLGSGGVKVAEYGAEYDGNSWTLSGQHYLLDRPKPPVDLPTEPTLGWLSAHTNPDPTLGAWRTEDRYVTRDGTYRLADDVTAFTPATAVPTKALDELRTQHRVNVTLESRYASVTRFLAAVDEANA